MDVTDRLPVSLGDGDGKKGSLGNDCVYVCMRTCVCVCVLCICVQAFDQHLRLDVHLTSQMPPLPPQHHLHHGHGEEGEGVLGPLAPHYHHKGHSTEVKGESTHTLMHTR